MRKNGLVPIQTPDGVYLPTNEDDACEVIRPGNEVEREQPVDDLITWRINYRVLIALVVVVVVAPIAISAIHKRQMRRMAAHFLERAEQAEADGDLKAAVSNIGNYLRFNPSDLEAGIRMALHLQTIAKTPREMQRVYYLFGRILRQDSQQREIRLKRAKLLLNQEGTFYLQEGLADLNFLQEQLTKKLKKLADAGMTGSPAADENRDEQVKIELLRAQCLERLSNFDEAIAAYQAIISLDPEQIESHKRLADLLDRRPKGKLEAGDVLNSLVRRNPDKSTSYVARAYHRQRSGELDGAIEDCREALKLAPDDPDVLILAATLVAFESKSRGRTRSFDIEEIRHSLEQTLEKTPKRAADDEKDQPPKEDNSPARRRELLIETLANLDIVSQQPEAAIHRLRKGLKDAPDDVLLRWVLANILVETGRVDDADLLLKEIHDLGNRSQLMDMLAARIDEARGDWQEAIEKCGKLSSDSLLRKVMPGEVELLRARCEEKLGHPERQLQAYRDAVQANPSSAIALKGLADSYSQLGQVTKAAIVLRELAEIPGIPIDLARLEIDRNLQLPKSSRNWGEVEQLLDIAAAQGEDIVDVLITRAQVRVHQGNREAASNLLRRASLEQPGQLKIWIALVHLKAGGGDLDGAFKILDQADKQFVKQPDLMLARLRLVPALGKPKSGELLDQLSTTLKEYDKKYQGDLFRGFARAYERGGDLDSAETYWKQVTQQQPLNLGVLRHRFDLAIRAGKLERIGGPDGLLAAMKKIEGESGSHYQLAIARYRIALAERGDRSQLDKARRGLERLASSGIMLAQVFVAMGQWEQLNNNAEQAVNHFRNAVERGSINPGVIRFLVRYDNSRGKYQDATRVIEQFRKNSRRPLTGEFGRMAAWSQAWDQNYEQAIDYALNTVDPHSRDFREHLLLGQLHLSAGRTDEADVYFRTALQYGENQPEAWIAWISFLKKSNRKADVAATLKKANQQFPADVNPLALSQCYEAAGEIEAAEKYSRAALQANRKDPALLQTVAEFYMRLRKPETAEKLLREMLTDDSTASTTQRTTARRSLAVVLGSYRGYPGFQEALKLLQKNLDVNSNSTSDLRTKAALLSNRPSRRGRREALSIFRRLRDRSMLQPADQFTVAKLHLALGEWDAAKAALESLQQARSHSPSVLAFGIRAMLDNGDLKLAGQWLKSLIAIQPNALRTIELQARHKIAVRQVNEGLAILDKATKPGKDKTPPVATKSQIAALLVGIAESLDSAGRAGDVKTVSQRAKEYLEATLGEHPEQVILLARLLSLEYDFQQALTRLEESWTSVNPELIATMTVGVLQRDPNRAQWIPKVHEHLEAAVQKTPDSSNLLFQAASLAHLEGDYDSAIRFYRHSLKLSPNSAATKNELALLLALRGESLEEAMKLINLAMAEVGPLPFLLDTRASIFLAMKQPEPAIRDLKLAIADTPSPAKYFHLAQAWLLVGNHMAAKSAMRSAIAAGIKPELIHPLERKALRELRGKLR